MKEEKVELDKKAKTDSEKKNNWWKYVIILIIIIIILLLLRSCGKGEKYKIKIHNGDDIIEVYDNFKLSDLDVEGGIASFLVDSDGYIVDPNSKLDHDKEYSIHVIPDGKEKVNVTYKNGSKSFTVKYQKGEGLLFPKTPTKEGYVFLGWQDEETKGYPAHMSPVNNDMTLAAQFGESVIEGGKCTLNCDTNGDGVCDLNCDKDGDGICDLNCDVNNDGVCDYKCDTDSDGICDLNCEEPESEPTFGVTYTCPNGYTLSGTICNKTVTNTNDAKISGYACESGYTLGSDNKCRKDVELSCPSGYTDGPNGCEKVTTVNASYSCGNPYHVCGDRCCQEDGTITERENPRAYCENGQQPQNGKCTI